MRDDEPFVVLNQIRTIVNRKPVDDDLEKRFDEVESLLADRKRKSRQGKSGRDRMERGGLDREE